MNPAIAISGEQQGDALTVQVLVVLPGKVVGQVRAVQLGPLAKFAGQLAIGPRGAA